MRVAGKSVCFVEKRISNLRFFVKPASGEPLPSIEPTSDKDARNCNCVNVTMPSVDE